MAGLDNIEIVRKTCGDQDPTFYYDRELLVKPHDEMTVPTELNPFLPRSGELAYVTHFDYSKYDNNYREVTVRVFAKADLERLISKAEKTGRAQGLVAARVGYHYDGYENSCEPETRFTTSRQELSIELERSETGYKLSVN